MDFKKEYQLSWKFISECRREIYWIVGAFFLFAVLGFAFAERLGFILDTLRGIVSETEGLDTLHLIIYIFLNNFSSALYGMVGGLLLGIIPFMNSIGNGTVLGFVAKSVAEKSSLLQLWRIFPHGIFELPAIFIALGIGVKMGQFWFSKNPKKEFVRVARNALRVVAFVIIPLLLVAAIIEGILIGILK